MAYVQIGDVRLPTTDRVCSDLTEIGEAMASVVDARARALLTSKYLALLARYQDMRRKRQQPGRDPALAREVTFLARQVRAGQADFKTQIGLGRVTDDFFRLYGQARAGVDRLRQLAGAQNDPGTKRLWAAEIEAVSDRLDILYKDAELASSNVHLSRLDSLEAQLGQLQARDIMGREITWRKALGLAAPAYSPGGRSGVVSLVARPDLMYPDWRTAPGNSGAGGFPRGNVPPSVARKAAGLGGWLDDLKEAVTGAWGTAVGETQAAAEKAWKDYQAQVDRAAKLKVAVAGASGALGALAKNDPEKASGLKPALDGVAVEIDSAVAELRGIAEEMDRLVPEGWAEPADYLKGRLGGLSITRSAAALFFAPRIRDVALALDSAEAGADKVRSALGAYLPKAAGGAVLALAAGAGLLLLARRGRR